MTAGLLQLQSALQQHVLTGAGDVAATLVTGHGLSAERRLHIYHHGYRARLVEALRDTFGHTATYLGEAWFDELAFAHVEAHPSSNANISLYGDRFAAWLHQRLAQDGEIGELAALDWALRRAFDGPDAAPLQVHDLHSVDADAWGRIGFAMVPTCTRLALKHNTLAIWHAIDSDQMPPRAEPLPQALEILIWRRGHQPHFRSLGDREVAALDAMQRGQSFAQICESLAQACPEADIAMEAGSLLRRWIDEELIGALVDPALAPVGSEAVGP